MDKKKRSPLDITVLVCSVLVIVFVLLQMLSILPWANLVYMPLMAVTMLAQAKRFWASSRSTAVISLISAVTLTVCTLMIWLGK